MMGNRTRRGYATERLREGPTRDLLPRKPAAARYPKPALCALLLALALPASPQQKVSSQPDAQQTPLYQSSTVLKATTRLVVVDVIASDKNGMPVTGLTQNDFSVTENGKPQKIRVFNFEQASTLAPAPKSFPPLPEGVFTNVPRYKSGGPFNVLLIDMLNTGWLNQSYLRAEMVGFLEKLPNDRPLAIYVLGSRLRLLQDFTSDPAVLREAIRNFKPSIPTLLDGPQEEKPHLEDLMEEMATARVNVRVNATIDALQSICRALAAYPGRKNLIWVSENFPFAIDPMVATTHSVSYFPEVAEVANTLTDAQVAIYPVDARGLDDGGPDPSLRIPGASSGQRYAAQIATNLQALGNTHAAMDELARKTGGEAFYNRNDLGNQVRRGIVDGSTYYTLGYYPDNKVWNGDFRRIKVKVARSGVSLRHRAGYFAFVSRPAGDRDPRDRMRSIDHAMGPDQPTSTSLLFEAVVMPPSAETANKVVVNFAIDPHALVFESSGDRQHAAVDCIVQIYSHGYPARSEVSTMTVALTPENYAAVMQSAFPCRNTFDLTPGKYMLRLGVIDNHTGLMGTAAARVDVPQTAADAAGATPEKK